MVRVEDDGNAVDGGDRGDVVSGSNGTGDGSLLLVGAVGNALAGEVGGTTLGTAKLSDILLTFMVWLILDPWDRYRISTHVWRMMGDLASRAASRAATAVEEEV